MFISEISLVDANYTINETIGTKIISLKELPYQDKEKQTIHFNKVTILTANLSLFVDRKNIPLVLILFHIILYRQ